MWKSKTGEVHGNRGRKSWNSGLTKEMDFRIAEMSTKVGRIGRISPMKGKQHNQTAKDKMKGHKSWCKGLTKETDFRLVESGKKVSLSNMGRISPMKGKHHSQFAKDLISKVSMGQPPWNKGLTKEMDVRLVRSENTKSKDPEYMRRMALIHQDPKWRKNQSNTTKKFWKDPEWAEKQMNKVLEGNQKVHPNKPEKQVLDILKSLSSDIKYVGDGRH